MSQIAGTAPDPTSQPGHGSRGNGEWWGSVGAAVGLDPRVVFAALSGCGCQGALLEAALPHAPWKAADEVRASPAAAARAAFGANTGGGFVSRLGLGS